MAEKDLNIYLTGVATEGDAQADPDASLGGKRSGTLVQAFNVAGLSNVTGVVIDDVSPSCGAGSATLAFTSAGTTLAFTAPGDTAGSTVDVSADGTYEIYSNDASKYIIVTVTAASLPGSNQSDSLTLTNFVENLFDSVGSGEAQAGDTEYRAVMVRNDSAYTMYSMIVWILTNTPFADDTVEIGIEAADGNGDIQSVANESTAPTSVSFSAPADEANALSIGNIDSAKNYGVWIKRVVTATTQRYADNSFSLNFKADTV